MCKLLQRLLASTACMVFLLSSVPRAALAQEAPPPTAPVQSGSPPPVDHTISEGTHVLDAAAVSKMASLTIDRGATAVIDFGNASHFTLPGDLVNKGNLFVGSSNSAVTAAHLNATNIVNRHGALISSVLPTEGVGGFTSAVANLDLVLNAVQNILNQGAIHSSGNLTMNAGGSIVNEAVMSAANNVNLMSAIGSITNMGTISSLAGNINVSAATAQNISLNNVGGVLEALNGSINVTAALANIDVTGGRLLSNAVNLISNTGAVTAMVDEVTGSLNVQGTYANVGASTENLNLGEVKVDGDPTFYNNAGNITITGNIAVAEDLAILASGDITAGLPFQIRARDETGQGHNIYLVAGASLTNPGGASRTAPGSPATGPVTVSGPSATGGVIFFTSNFPPTIDASSSAGNFNGANIVLLAYKGSTGGSGAILLPTSTLLASGNGTGNNGNVTLIGGNPGTSAAIDIGVISAGGSTGTAAGTGVVSVYSAQPAFSTGTSLTFGTNGAITSGNSFVPGAFSGANVILRGNVSAADVIVSNSSGTVGGEISALGVITAKNTINVTAGSDVTVGLPVPLPSGILVPGFVAPQVTLTSYNGSIGADTVRVATTAGNLIANATGPGGNVFIAELDGVTVGSSAAAGTFDLLAGGSINVTAPINATDIVLTTTTAASDIIVQAPVTASNSLAASSAGAIRQGVVAMTGPRPGSLSAPIMTLSAANQIGGDPTADFFSDRHGASLQIDAGQLVVSSSTSFVFLDELNAIVLGPGSSSTGPATPLAAPGNSFSLAAGADITVNGSVTSGARLDLLALSSASVSGTGGKITVNADLTTASTNEDAHPVLLFADGDVLTAPGVKLRGPTVSLFSQNGSVGTSLNPVGTALTTSQSGNNFLAARAPAGDVYVNNQSSFVRVTAGEALGTWSLESTGTIRGPLSPAAPILAPTGTVILTGTGSGGAGIIGQPSDRVRIDAAYLIVNGPSTGAYIEESNSVTLSQPSTLGHEFNLIAGGDITVDAPLTAGTIATSSLSLSTSAGSGGDITFNADAANINGSVIVFADADIIASSTAFLRAANSAFVILNSNHGSIGTGTTGRVNIDANRVQANAPLGSAYLSETDGVDIFLTSSAAGTFDLQSGGTISNSGTGTVSADVVVLTATSGGGITLAQNVTATGSILLTAGGSIQTTGGASLLVPTGKVELTSSSGTVNVLTDAADLLVVTSHPTGLGHADIDELNSVNLVSASVSGIFTINAGGDITTSGAVTAGEVRIATKPGSAGDITIGADVQGGLTSSGLVSVNADGGINSSNGAAFVGHGVNLTANESIGSGNPVDTRTHAAATDMTLLASSLNGDVFVNHSGTATVVSSSAAGTWDLKSSGNIATFGGGDAIVAHDISLQSQGAVTVNGALTATAPSNSGHIALSGSSVSILSPVTASGSVQIKPTSSTSGSFIVDTSQLGQITSPRLFIGSTDSGPVNVQNNIELVGTSNFSNIGTEVDVITQGNISTTGSTLVGTPTLNMVLISTNNSIDLGVVSNFARFNPISTNGSVNATDDISAVAALQLSADQVLNIASGVLVNADNLIASATTLNNSGSVSVINQFLINASVINNSSAISGSGNIFISGFPSLTITGSTGQLTAGNSLFLDSNGSVNVNQSSISGTVAGTTNSDLAVHASSSGLTLGQISAVGLASLASDTGTITTTANLSAASAAFTTTRLIVNSTITATGLTGTVTVQNPVGTSSLTVEGMGTVTAPGGTHLTANGTTPTMTLGTAGQTLTFNGDLFANCCAGSVNVTSGTTISASANVTIQACFLSNPDGIQLQNPSSTLTFNVCPTCNAGNGGRRGGTIANPGGDVVLAKNLVVSVDGDLAIIARNNVIAPDNVKNINLNAGSGDAGNLTIIAGFSFTPGTTGQVFDKTTPFVIDGPSTGGGSVLLGSININTKGTGPGANGGSVLIVAHSGTVNAGNIAIGNINTGSNTAAGGDIRIIAEGSVQTGQINTLGPSHNGIIEVSVGKEPVPTGDIIVRNGTIITNETFVPEMGAPFTLFIMPTSVIAPISLPAPPSSTSSGGGSGPSASADTDDESALVPVSFLQPAAPLGVIKNGICTVTHETATIKHDGNAELKVDRPGVIQLNRGDEVLIFASKNTIIEAGIAQVSVSKGTIAALRKDGNSIMVRNLYETRSNSVTVYIDGKHSHQLAAGREIVLGKDGAAMRATLSDQLVGRRKLTRHDLACGISAASCEFSLPAFLQNSHVLKKLAESNDKADRIVTGKLTKMAACLHILGAGRGAYTNGGRL